MLSIFFLFYIRGRQHTRIVRYRSTFHFNMITVRHYSRASIGMASRHGIASASQWITYIRSHAPFSHLHWTKCEYMNRLISSVSRRKEEHFCPIPWAKQEKKNYFHFIFSTFLPMVGHHLPCVRFYRSAYSQRGRLWHFISVLLLFAQRSLTHSLTRSFALYTIALFSISSVSAIQ